MPDFIVYLCYSVLDYLADRTRTRTNTNPNGTEANAAAEVHARALRASQKVKRAEVWVIKANKNHILELDTRLLYALLLRRLLRPF